MWTQAELDKMHREDALDKVAEFIGDEYPEEVMEMAADIAQDNYDCDCDSDGFFDCTDYESAAKQAIALWEEDQRARHEAALDDFAHAHADRLAGL
jgi:hypothetical protein